MNAESLLPPSHLKDIRSSCADWASLRGRAFCSLLILRVIQKYNKKESFEYEIQVRFDLQLPQEHL